MASARQHRIRTFGTLRAAATGLALAAVFGTTIVANLSAQAPVYTVIHNFSGSQQDGAGPFAGLTINAAGTLYGTTWGGGLGYGTVFRLTQKSPNWIFGLLYSFAGGNDGEQPEARVVLGRDGALYGTTVAGGNAGCNGSGCGMVFNLKPLPTPCKTALCPWTETVLYRFSGGGDGGDSNSEVTFDQGGNIYGTTVLGGPDCFFRGCGVVYKLTPSGNGHWTEGVLYSFSLGNDGAYPVGEVIFDNAGNLYGTTSGYSDGTFAPYGTVYELMPMGGGWMEKTLYTFQGGNDGGAPYAGLIFDDSGNLYGATTSYGAGGGGTVFKLTPAAGTWTLETLYSFSGGSNGGPDRSLVMDRARNLYGTTHFDGKYGYGAVFELSPSNGGWTYKSLHDFTGGSDGGVPISSVVHDTSGNLYGTTFGGGAYGDGVVWEITP